MLEQLFIPLAIVTIGFAVLVWAANLFVTGAAATARNFGISPLVIGLTVVGLGTSAPEMIVAAISAFQGKPTMAIGNAIGSNITNIALILGTTAIIAPIVVKSAIISRELPMLMIITLIAVFLLWDKNLQRIDGVLLIISLFMVLSWISRQAKHERDGVISEQLDIEFASGYSTTKGILLTLIGITLMLTSSHYIVDGAVKIAKYMGLSDLVIGLTIIAIGTSLPELAASVVAALKKVHELAIGNVIGSNIFNLLGVLAIPALVAPTAVPAELISRDLPVMIILTLALFATAYSFGPNHGRINRVEGLFLVISFFAYQAYLYTSSISTN